MAKSAEETLARIYNIARGVVSPKYLSSDKELTASKVLRGLIPYAEKHLSRNGRLWDICKHTLHLVHGVKGARKWRNELSITAQKRNAKLIVLEKAARHLEDAGL